MFIMTLHGGLISCFCESKTIDGMMRTNVAMLLVISVIGLLIVYLSINELFQSAVNGPLTCN